MTDLRSNLPSGIRQLMNQTDFGPSLKLEYQPSPRVTAFIEEVIQCPLQEIAIPLSGFRWQYGKGNFHHWKPMFLHFETYFRTYVSCRQELLLSSDILSDAVPFPKQEVLQILRVMQIIFENCQNKSSFVGLEHFKLLLASTDPEILIAALETLAALVKIIPSKLHASGKLVECGSLNSLLLSLAQGWGSTEGGLGLFSCISLTEKTKDDGLCLSDDSENLQVRVGSTLYFELHGNTPSGTSVIHLPDLQLRDENDLSLMKICIEEYNVPLELRFSLLTKIRYACAFRSSSICRLYSKICLLAFVVLVQSSDSNDELVSFFGNEPEYTSEIIKIVKSEETILDDLKTLAMTALGAQVAAHSASHERASVLSRSIISVNGGNHMILLNVLQRAILSLKLSSDMPSVAFVEALLHFYLFHVITSSSTGNVFRGSDIVQTFLPLFEDFDPSHLHLVCLVVKIIQNLMDFSSTSVTFRDLGGVELLVHRLQIEVHQVIENGGKGNSIATQKRLIRALLKALGSTTRAITNSRGSQYSNEVSLTPTLSIIFSNKEQFGGEIYAAAVTLMNEMIHRDPTCFNTLYSLGLPTTFLSSVVSGAIDSPKAVACIPSGIGAICLNAKGLEAVKETQALSFLFNVFTEQKYVMAVNDCIIPMVNNIEELLRHVTSLRSIGVDQMIKIIHKVESLGEKMCNQSAEKVEGTDAMELDSIESKDKENFGAGDSSDNSISIEQCMQALIFHVMVLVHKTLKKTETCRLFVEKAGIEALLKLLLRTSITQSSNGTPIALYSTMVFKCFTQNHSTLLAHSLCSALKDHMKKTLTELTAVSGCFLLDTSINPDTKIFSTLSLVEFLLFLAVSKDNSWFTALLTEFSNDNKNVLEDIGRIHREIMWQVALLEDTKVEKESGLSGRHTKSIVHDGADPRLNFFGQNVTGQNLSSSELIAKKNEENKKPYHKSACDMVQSLSIHITRLFKELGRVMLLPSRRRNDSLIVSPASKSVASTFASISMDHMIFAGRSGSETSVPTTCCYSGKVAEFINGILLEKPDSCNPVILNCLYGKGVIHFFLTTFESTTRLAFAVNRGPASPIQTNEVSRSEIEGERLWIDGPLASYGKLIDHLATSSFIISPPTKHLLTQPLVSGEITFPRDAEKFVKNLQSMVLKVVLPVWSHPRFPEHSHEFVATMICILRHIFSGVEVRNVTSNNADRVAGPPPSETTILTIVEMGFSRRRAEEALRQVGSNSVELAMEWLFSHPEEVQEDDEFARALAMSMGDAGADTKEDVATYASDSVEEERVKVPPVDELLLVCKKLVLTNDTLVFPVRDLLSMICSKNEGQDRSKVLLFIIEQVNLCGNVLDSVNQNMLSAFLHVLALILNEDVDAREFASKCGLVKLVADLLSLWISGSPDQEASQVPKWVTSAFVAVDQLAQVDTSLNADVVELLKKNNQVSDQTSLVFDEDKHKLLDIREQKRLIEIACGCLEKQLPSETTHAILQLCVTLTRIHSVAVCFLEAGGLHLLLSLPVTSLFAGFDNIAASITRHILEDSHTLQQAMESEIKRTVATAAYRQASGKLTARSFLSSLTSTVERDPVTFMQAAKVVCQVETVENRPYIVLVKDRDKDKAREKDIADEKEKLDGNSRNSKIHKKPPQSFVNVIDILLDSVISFVPPPLEDKSITEIGSSSECGMEIDVSVSKGKGKYIVTVSEDKEAANSQESSISMVRVVAILKLLTEALLMYGASVNILIRKDASCGIFHHVLHQFLPYSKTHNEMKSEGCCRHRLASISNQILVASCVRSTEARKRIFTIIGNVFNDFGNSPNGFRAPRVDIQSHIEFLNGVLTACSPTGSCISGEASVTFTQTSLVQSVTRVLRVLDLDHTDTPKVTTGILKVLELVTKEHIRAFESKDGKNEHLVKPNDNNQPREDSGVTTTQPLYTSIQSNENVMAADRVESFSTVHTYGGSGNIFDDMEHDQDIEDGLNAIIEDDYMEENGQEDLNGDDMSDMYGEADDDDGEHNDIEEDHDHHHLQLSPDMDNDDHEIDEDEFDEEVMEEDEDREYDESTLTVRLGSGMGGIDVIDHLELLGREAVESDGIHVMPDPGRTASIFALLGRNDDDIAAPQHPFLVEPRSLSGLSRSSGTGRDGHLARNLENSVPQFDALFRSLRNGRQGDIFNFLATGSQLSGSSRSSVIPQGLEELLISSLRWPHSGKASHNTTLTESHNVTEVNPSSELAENQEINVNPPAILDTSQRRDDITLAVNESIQGISSSLPLSVSDVEAVSQNNSESGPNLDRSLRSHDIVLGTADGHNDEDARMRRARVSVRDASLDSVAEVAEDPIREGDQGEEQQSIGEADSIDPAFLDALPEELRTEVLSGQQSLPQQQPQRPEPHNNEEIDPEFLAALPPTIREEVLAQQRVQRRVQSTESAQPVEMDTGSIIATFPADIREEVLLTSSDDVIASLSPALVAEANMLREQLADRFNQPLFGIHPSGRRDESYRGVDFLDRLGSLFSRPRVIIKPVEMEGSSLVDKESLKALIRLLNVVEPLYKNEQKLLLNICAHAESRIDLLNIMMELLMCDKRKCPSDLNASESPYRLYGNQSHVIHSHPQCVNGIPPLVSRRVLETLTYLARSHPLVAKQLLEFRFPKYSLSGDKRGKTIMVDDENMINPGQAYFTLLFSLLNQSLYLRSIAHLEQLLNLLNAVINNVEKQSNSSDAQMPSASEQPSDPPISTAVTQMNVVSTPTSGEGDVTMRASSFGSDKDQNAIKDNNVTMDASSSGSAKDQNALIVLNDLPKPELQLLCSLLTREGLSDNAYTLVAEVLRKLVVIAPLHCHLFVSELSGSVQSLIKSATGELQAFGDVEKSFLSSSATHGAPVLRVVQALSSLVSLGNEDKNPDIAKKTTAVVSLIRNVNTVLEPLWQELSNCIGEIEKYLDILPDPSPSSVKPSGAVPPLPAGTQNLLPYIESFFITCDKLHHDVGSTAVSDVDEGNTSSNQQKASMVGVVEKSVRFSEKHRKLLNTFIRQNPGLLEKSFSLMLKLPRLIDFDNKRSHFRSKIKHDRFHSSLRISVRRAYILEDSYNQLRMRPAQDLKRRLTVHFQGEEGIDAGGLTREWYQVLSRVVFDKGALLFTTVGYESTFQPNPNSVYQTEHLSYFKFVGRVVGKALLDEQLLDVHFTRSFYKHILGVKVTYHDIEAIDPDYFKNLKWLLENDISDILDLTFSIDADEEKLILYERTEVTDYELIPGGRNIRVTEENKHQYVDLVAEHRLTTAIRPQINAFMDGFNEVISRDLISIFNDKELELLISGLPDIDLDDLRANTEYFGYNSGSPAIQWFWEVVQGFSNEDKARLLQFVTGTSKVPLEGFNALQGLSGSQKFQIHKAYGSTDHLPSAHTCFNQLDLPEYPCKQRLEERLILAIHEANEGFGFS